VDLTAWVDLAGHGLDIAGVTAVVIGAAVGGVLAIIRAIRRQGPVYRPFRRFLGRSILLGLELLVAADIIRTVAVTPTLASVAVLAGIVLIRTFLSFSLELEIPAHLVVSRPGPGAEGRGTRIRDGAPEYPAEAPHGRGGRKRSGRWRSSNNRAGTVAPT
jgi:uncharacterized membrane protein